jgi:hypothetical protein
VFPELPRLSSSSRSARQFNRRLSFAHGFSPKSAIGAMADTTLTPSNRGAAVKQTIGGKVGNTCNVERVMRLVRDATVIPCKSGTFRRDGSRACARIASNVKLSSERRLAKTDHHTGIAECPGSAARHGFDHPQQSRVFLQRLQDALIVGFPERGFYEHEFFYIGDRHLFA